MKCKKPKNEKINLIIKRCLHLCKFIRIHFTIRRRGVEQDSLGITYLRMLKLLYVINANLEFLFLKLPHSNSILPKNSPIELYNNKTKLHL